MKGVRLTVVGTCFSGCDQEFPGEVTEVLGQDFVSEQYVTVFVGQFG